MFEKITAVSAVSENYLNPVLFESSEPGVRPRGLSLGHGVFGRGKPWAPSAARGPALDKRGVTGCWKPWDPRGGARRTFVYVRGLSATKGRGVPAQGARMSPCLDPNSGSLAGVTLQTLY